MRMSLREGQDDTVETGGRGAIVWTDPRTGSRLQVEFSYRVDHGVLGIMAYLVTSLNGEPISRKVRRALEDGLEGAAQRWHSAQAGWREAHSVAGGSVRLGWADVPAEATWRSVDPQLTYADLKAGQPLRFHDSALSRDVRQSLQERRVRRVTDHNLLEEVAKIYAAADRAPTKAVREHFNVSAAQASRYVAYARKYGYLPALPRKV